MKIKDYTDTIRHLTDSFNIPEARRMIAENPALSREQFAEGQLVQPGPGRPGYAGLTDGRTTSPLISKEKLKKLRPKFQIKEIAEKTKTSKATVNRLLRKYDLLGQGSYIPGGYRGYVSPERLKLEKKLPQIRKLYLVDKLSEHQIAKKLDTVPSKIEAILNEARGVTNSAREPERKKLYKENKITEAQFKKRGSWPLAGTSPDVREKVIKDSKNYSVKEVAQRNNLSDQTVIKIAKEEKLKFPYRAHVLGRLKEHVTENANKLLNVLRKDTKLIKNMEKAYELAGLSKRSGDIAIQALKVPTVLSGNVPRFKFSKTDKKIVEAITPPRISAEAEALKAGASKADVRSGMLRPRVALQEYFAEGDVGKRGTVFEHAFPRSLIPYVKDKKLAKQLQITGERTSPFLNDFKIRYDRLQKSAVDQFLKDGNLSQYNKTINQIRDTVRKATVGYEIGYIKFDKNKNPTPVVKSKPITEGIKQFGVETTQKVSGFKNSKYTTTLLKNYVKDPDNRIFNTLRDEVPVEKITPEVIKASEDATKAYKKAEPFIGTKQKFLNFAKRNLNNLLVNALFKSPYGRAAVITGAVLSPSLLAAEEAQAGETGVVEKAKSWPIEHPWLTGAGATGVSKLTKADPLKYFRKVPRKIFSSLGTPAGAVAAWPLAAMGMKKAGWMEEDTPAFDIKSTGDRIGAEAELMLAPTLVSWTDKLTKPIKNKAVRSAAAQLLNLGMKPATAMRVARIASPLGLLSLGGEGLYHMYKKGHFDKERMMPSLMDKEAYKEAQQEQFDVNQPMFAGGGLANLTRTVAPDSGPVSQGPKGLAYLKKC